MGNQQSTILPAEVIPASIEYHLFRISRPSRIIYLTSLLMVLLTLTALPVVYVDISVSSPGWIHSGIRQQGLFVAATGRVVFSGIRADKEVRAGDTLLVLDTKALHSQLEMLMFRSSENILEVSDLKLLVQIDQMGKLPARSSLRSSVYRSDYAGFIRQYNRQQSIVRKHASDHRRTELLYINDVLPASELEESVHSLNQETALLDLMMLQQLGNWKNDLSRKLSDQERLKADIDYATEEISKCFLLAPVDGKIIFSTDVQPGSFVLGNQHIAELSPEGEFFVSAKVSPVDIGHLYHGQEVRVAVDAYNHNHWGMIRAHIMEISGDVVIDPLSNHPYYRVKCRLHADSLVHKNGSVGRLRKGMTVNCRMIKTRKSLFHLIINKADEMLNPAANSLQ